MKGLVVFTFILALISSGCSTAPPASAYGNSRYYRSGFNNVYQGMVRIDVMAAMADYKFHGRQIENNQEVLIFEDSWSSPGGSLYNKYYIGMASEKVVSARIQFYENNNEVVYIFGL